MKFAFVVASVVAVFYVTESAFSPAKVQVYSQGPGAFGEANTLICHVTDFHPPNIDIKLLKNGEEMPNAKQSDLAFGTGWRFHLTKRVDFTPQKEDRYTCQVKHGEEKARDFLWESNM